MACPPFPSCNHHHQDVYNMFRLGDAELNLHFNLNLYLPLGSPGLRGRTHRFPDSKRWNKWHNDGVGCGSSSPTCITREFCRYQPTVADAPRLECGHVSPNVGKKPYMEHLGMRWFVSYRPIPWLFPCTSVLRLFWKVSQSLRLQKHRENR